MKLCGWRGPDEGRCLRGAPAAGLLGVWAEVRRQAETDEEQQRGEKSRWFDWRSGGWGLLIHCNQGAPNHRMKHSLKSK